MEAILAMPIPPNFGDVMTQTGLAQPPGTRIMKVSRSRGGISRPSVIVDPGFVTIVDAPGRGPWLSVGLRMPAFCLHLLVAALAAYLCGRARPAIHHDSPEMPSDYALTDKCSHPAVVLGGQGRDRRREAG
jgi:hypothetical protein